MILHGLCPSIRRPSTNGHGISYSMYTVIDGNFAGLSWRPSYGLSYLLIGGACRFLAFDNSAQGNLRVTH